MTKAKKLKISWNCLKNKILAIIKVKKKSQDYKKEEKKVLIDIYFNKKVIQMLIIDLKLSIYENELRL